jgi:hypothetical protein
LDFWFENMPSGNPDLEQKEPSVKRPYCFHAFIVLGRNLKKRKKKTFLFVSLGKAPQFAAIYFRKYFNTFYVLPAMSCHYVCRKVLKIGTPLRSDRER